MHHYSHYTVMYHIISFMMHLASSSILFFFNDTATTEIYTLSLHDALPISHVLRASRSPQSAADVRPAHRLRLHRSEEHTSELQSPCNLVCRLLLEKKKKYARSLSTSIIYRLRINYCHSIATVLLLTI